MTNYKAGDLVTVRIDQRNADNLNLDDGLGFRCNNSQIVSHEPAKDLLDEAEQAQPKLITQGKFVPSEYMGFVRAQTLLIQYLKQQRDAK